MVAIVMIMVAALAACVIFDKRPEETIPVALFTTTLGEYAFALFLPLNVSVYIVSGIVGAAALVAAALSVRKRKKITERSGTVAAFVPMLVLVLTCIVFCALLYNRRPFFYDDLSYWAIYTKNIFCIDKLPHLFENCSVDYKDYTPIIQILQYIALFGRKTFAEPVMFQANVCLIYILLLPLLFGIEEKSRPLPVRVAAVIAYVIFPHVFTAQFYYRLGVDLLLALTFGYALYYIFIYKENDLFGVVALVTSMSFLALIKSSGIVLCLFAIVMYLAQKVGSPGRISTKEKNALYAIARTAVISLFTFGSYFSWQLFLRYSWNNGYLSNRVKDGIKGGGFAFPAYTGEVVRNYIMHFFTYPLTRNNIGITAAVLTLFMIVVFCLTRKNGEGAKKTFVLIMICLVIFAIAHLSMYLFVFDEWEAHGLLEFDRYITQYLGGAVFLYLCILIRGSGDAKEKGAAGKCSVLLYVTLAVFIVLLPYADMNDFLIPSHFEKIYTDRYAKMTKEVSDEWEASGIDEMDFAHDGSARLTVFADVWDESTQFLEYYAAPQPIDNLINVSAVEAGNLVGFSESRLEQYVYVAKGAEAAYAGDWSETGDLTDDGEPLREGVLYRIRKDNDTKTLVKVQ